MSSTSHRRHYPFFLSLWGWDTFMDGLSWKPPSLSFFICKLGRILLASHAEWSIHVVDSYPLAQVRAQWPGQEGVVPTPCCPARCSEGGSHCEAARVNTMTGGLDLSFGFPRNGKIPQPHQVTWSQPINMLPVGNKGRTEKPEKVCTNKIALQTCSQSA